MKQLKSLPIHVIIDLHNHSSVKALFAQTIQEVWK